MSGKRNKYERLRASLRSDLEKNQQLSNAKEESKFTKWYHKHIGLYTIIVAIIAIASTIVFSIISTRIMQKQESLAEQTLLEQIKVNQASIKEKTTDSIRKFKEKVFSYIADKGMDTVLKKEMINNEIKEIFVLVDSNPEFLSSVLSVVSILNIRNIVIPKLHIANQNIANLNLKNVVFQDLKFENVSLDKIKFSDCTFLNSKFIGCVFSESGFYSCQLISPYLSHCKFSEWTKFSSLLQSATFDNIDAVGAEFQSSDLTWSRFSGNLHSADFSNSDLRNTTFFNCVLQGANFSNSDLRASTFQHVSLVGPNPLSELGNMKLTGVTLGERDTIKSEIDLTSGLSKGSDTIGGISITKIDYDVGPIKATLKGAKIGNMKWDDRIFEEDAIGNDITFKDGSYGMKISTGTKNKRKR